MTAPTAITRVPATTNPISNCLASSLRSVSRTADCGTEAMMAFQVCVWLPVSLSPATGSSNSSISMVSPGAGIGGSAIRAIRTVSLAAVVTINKPSRIAPDGTDCSHP